MVIYTDFTMYFLHFGSSGTIGFASYLPVTPALPVTSASGPLPKYYTISIIALYFIAIA